MKIYVRELKCYRDLPREKRESARIKGDTCFTISNVLTKDMQEILSAFIKKRGEELALDSLRGELWKMHALCRFFADRYPDLSSPCEIELAQLIKSLKVWMVKNGYRLTGEHSRLNADTVEIKTSPLLLYLESIYAFVSNEDDLPETEKDVWDLSKLGFEVRNNPTHAIHTLDFTPIAQKEMRDETKQAVLVSLRYLAAPTISQQLRSIKRLSVFLTGHYSEITSAQQLNRDIIEDYLTYLNTEVTGKKSFRSEIASLKSLLETISLVTETPHMAGLFLPGDTTDRGRISKYKAYSDDEVRMWNEAILTLPSQIARALVIHQLLGNRISETLTLTNDCICERGGHTKVKVFQQKTQTTVYKPAGEKVVALIKKAGEETHQTYGERKYIFVNDRDPDLPMTYATVQYHLMKLIRQLDLRNENGELYGVGTHAFRHTMGQKLTQMHYDDKTIAQLLGHSSMESVHKYRKFGSKALSEETRIMRDKQDQIIEQITKEWDTDEI